MDEKRKKILTYGGLGLAVAVVLYLVWRSSQSTSGQPDSSTLGQYAAQFRGGSVGGYSFAPNVAPAGNDSSGAPGLTSVVPQSFTPRPEGGPSTFPGGQHPGPDPVSPPTPLSGGGGVFDEIMTGLVKRSPVPIGGPGGGGYIGGPSPATGVITSLSQITSNPIHTAAAVSVGPANFGTGGPIGTRPILANMSDKTSLMRGPNPIQPN